MSACSGGFYRAELDECLRLSSANHANTAELSIALTLAPKLSSMKTPQVVRYRAASPSETNPASNHSNPSQLK